MEENTERKLCDILLEVLENKENKKQLDLLRDVYNKSRFVFCGLDKVKVDEIYGKLVNYAEGFYDGIKGAVFDQTEFDEKHVDFAEFFDLWQWFCFNMADVEGDYKAHHRLSSDMKNNKERMRPIFKNNYVKQQLAKRAQLYVGAGKGFCPFSYRPFSTDFS